MEVLPALRQHPSCLHLLSRAESTGLFWPSGRWVNQKHFPSSRNGELFDPSPCLLVCFKSVNQLVLSHNNLFANRKLIYLFVERKKAHLMKSICGWILEDWRVFVSEQGQERLSFLLSDRIRSRSLTAEPSESSTRVAVEQVFGWVWITDLHVIATLTIVCQLNITWCKTSS